MQDVGSLFFLRNAIAWCVMCVLLVPILATAQTTSTRAVQGTSTRIVTLPDPLGGADIPTVIGRVISTFLGMIGAASLLVFVYAGVRYLTAGGREEMIKNAQATMKYAFFGLMLIVFAYVITNFYFTALVGSV